MLHLMRVPVSPLAFARSCAMSRQGAAVDERLAGSPPTKAIWVQFSAGSPDFCIWGSCRTMPLVGEFSRGSPVSSALSFQWRSILTSITLIGSEDHSVKGRPNILTHYVVPKMKFFDIRRKFFGGDYSTFSMMRPTFLLLLVLRGLPECPALQ
ncbi:hypothetical protein PR048_012394 [Dryococelus australis]|uniref:Uncharacterized protein n=1 Tax=Dryococelus australis TaxID=614101 RepID=A0ABQ9HP82_9NEOP|nr:hypothetical protein PR048_012394 [Dryococelus australis]